MRNKLAVLRAFLPLLMVTCLANAQGINAPTAPAAPASPAEPRQCRALDAMGHPIPKAAIQTWHVPFGKHDAPPADIASSETDENGNFALPKNEGPSQIMVRLVHPDYGIAESDTRFFEPGGAIYFPLVRKGTEADSGALRGIVLDPENHPVAGARVAVASVWAMGDWLFTGTFKGSVVFTDKAGRFRFSVPVGPSGFTASSAPVPLNSWFWVITREPNFALFPDSGAYRSSEEAVIHLTRPEWFHRFVFLGSDGQPLPADAPAQVQVVYKAPEALKGRIALPLNRLVKGAKIPLGQYSAYYVGPSETVELTQDSPEEVVFRFQRPPTVTYVGRVVDGVTGKPLAGAFVIPGIYRGALDWTAIGRLQEEHHVPFVRTDAEGKYSIVPDASCFDLTAYKEGLLPFTIHTYELKADDGGRVALPDAPLFPAAKVLVKSSFFHANDGTLYESLLWNWLLEKEDQPAWFARFSEGARRENGYNIFSDAQKPDEEIPLCVPAGVRLRLSIRTAVPSEPAFRVYREPLLLDPGQVMKLDDRNFIPYSKVSVRVADARGKPLSWINIKRFYDGGAEEDDCVWHCTDSAGLVQFYMIPGSSGHFAVAALEKLPPAAGQAKAEAAFRIPADKAPAEPFVITLSDQQIERLSKMLPVLK